MKRRILDVNKGVMIPMNDQDKRVVEGSYSEDNSEKTEERVELMEGAIQ